MSLLKFLSSFSVTSAQVITLVNYCGFPIQYQAVTFNGASGPYTIAPSSSGSYPFEVGLSIKTYIDDPSDITQYELSYWSTEAEVTYDISHQNGDPFGMMGEALIPSDSSCQSFVCAAGEIPCKSSYTAPGEDGPIPPNNNCTLPFDLTATVCSGYASPQTRLSRKWKTRAYQWW